MSGHALLTRNGFSHFQSFFVLLAADLGKDGGVGLASMLLDEFVEGVPC